MRRDWLQTATDAIRRHDHRTTLQGAVAGLGGAIAIGGMEWFSRAAHTPLVVIPFATSIVLVVGSPERASRQKDIPSKAHRYNGLAPSLRFCSANRSPSRTSTTLR